MNAKIAAMSLVTAALGLAASSSWAAGVGTTGAQFLQVGVGARPLAMGGAFSALPDDANAINWNPGAIGALKDRSVTMSYNSLFDGENQGFIGYAHPLPNSWGVVAGGLNYLTIGSIEKRAGDTESPDSTFSNNNFALSASYGRATPVDGLALGANLKYIRTTLDTFNGNAVALDAGALYKTKIEHLSLGASLQNLGTKLGPDALPTSLKGGAAYRAAGEKLVLASDIDWLEQDRRAYWDLGTEFWAHRNLAVRMGYQVGRSQDHLGSSIVGFTFGLGVWIDKFRMDYAFLPFGNLGDTHRITLGWIF